MAQSGWFAMAMRHDFDEQVRIICQKISINPDERGAYAKAIRYAVAFTVAAYTPETKEPPNVTG